MLLSFNLKTNCVPVNLDSTGYELREMTAAQRDSYLDSLSERIRSGADGKATGVKKFEGLQADLLTRCLFKSGESKSVTKEIVQSWPASVVSSLFIEAQKINQLNQSEKEIVADSKND